MHRSWKVRRREVESPDALRRWDRAYQCLLQWEKAPQESPSSPEASPRSAPADLPTQEAGHESRPLCPRLDPSTGSGADD